MFPTFEQSGHQYGDQLMYVCLSPVGGTTLLFMTPGWLNVSTERKRWEKIPGSQPKRAEHVLQGPIAAY